MQFAEYSAGTVPQTSRLRYRVFNNLVLSRYRSYIHNQLRPAVEDSFAPLEVTPSVVFESATRKVGNSNFAI
jgi:hypothetical protein